MLSRDPVRNTTRDYPCGKGVFRFCWWNDTVQFGRQSSGKYKDHCCYGYAGVAGRCRDG